MDDLGAAISGFLEQPGAMEQLEAMAKQLGLTPPSADSAPEQAQQPLGIPGLSMEKLRPVLETMQASGRPTAQTALLEALAPLLGEEARDKLDRAKRAMGLMYAVRAVAGTIEL